MRSDAATFVDIFKRYLSHSESKGPGLYIELSVDKFLLQHITENQCVKIYTS